MTKRSDTSSIAIAAITLSLALGVGGVVLRTVNAEPVERSAQVAGSIAFAIVFMTPAFLGLLGLRGRPALLVSAGALDVVLGILGLFSVGVLFLVPAVLFFIASTRARRSGLGELRSGMAVVLSVALGAAALFALFAREDPVCWAKIRSTGETVRLDPAPFVHANSISLGSENLPPGTEESGCTSDSISSAEAVASLALVGMMLVVAWSISRPPTPIEAPAPAPG